MLDSLTRVLSGNPILTLFLVMGTGYVLGRINIFGFRLGVAGVLFMGLAFGALGPNIALPEVVTSLGLIIFVYAVGLQAGPTFFQSFRKQGSRDTLLAGGVVLLGAGIALALGRVLALNGPRIAGLFCGAMTNTPALAAARETVRTAAAAQGLGAVALQTAAAEPVVTYSIAYPIGVIGVLLCFQLFRRIWHVDLAPGEEAPTIRTCDLLVKNPAIVGRSVGDVLRLHRDPGFVVSRIRHGGKTKIATPTTMLSEGDVVVVVGDAEAMERAQQMFGAPAEEHLELDHSEIDFRRVFVSSEEVVGKTIRELDLPHRMNATVTRLRRGDIDVVPTEDTRLEYGDRVRVLTMRANFPAIAKFFGDSIRGTAETDFGSVGLGIVIGALVGMLPIPLPGGSTVTLGLAGGPLLVALVLGYIGHTGRITWTMPVSANLTLREIGLLLFLAAVGTRAGYSFVDTIRTNGIQLLAAGALLTFVVTAATLIIGYKLLKIPFDVLMGVMAGVQTQPALLAYAGGLTKSDRPNAGYVGVYPVAMILKIVLAQLLV